MWSWIDPAAVDWTRPSLRSQPCSEVGRRAHVVLVVGEHPFPRRSPGGLVRSVDRLVEPALGVESARIRIAPLEPRRGRYLLQAQTDRAEEVGLNGLEHV